MSGQGSETWWRVTHLCLDGPSHTVPQQLYETPCPSPPDLQKTEAGWSGAPSCPDQQCQQQNSPPGPPLPKQVTLQWFPAEASPVTLISVVSQGPTVASAKTPPSLLVGHFDATGRRCQGPWGSAPRTVSTQSFQRAVRTPTRWLLLGGPPSFPMGSSSLKLHLLERSPGCVLPSPHLGQLTCSCFTLGHQVTSLQPDGGPWGRPPWPMGWWTAPSPRPFAQAICTGQAAQVVPVTGSTLHGHVWAGSDGQAVGQGTAVQLRWRDRSCPGGARGAPLVLDVSPHSVGAALGVLVPVPSPIQPGAGLQRAREHPETQKCKMTGK